MTSEERRQAEANTVAEAYLEWMDEREEDDTVPIDDVRRHEILMLVALVRDALDKEARATEDEAVRSPNAWPIDHAEALQSAVEDVRAWHRNPPGTGSQSDTYNLLADFAERELLFRGAK